MRCREIVARDQLFHCSNGMMLDFGVKKRLSRADSRFAKH
jgi:hypothetical protein